MYMIEASQHTLLVNENEIGDSGSIRHRMPMICEIIKCNRIIDCNVKTIEETIYKVYST